MHEKSKSSFDASATMKCIDEAYEIKGDYDTNSAANLMVVFDICDPNKRKCKSEDEIRAFLEFKYIIYIDNDKVFT